MSVLGAARAMTNEEARKEAALDEFAKAALVGLLAGPEPGRYA